MRMEIFQAYRMAIKSILSNKIRSFLTMLGVIIGVASVIAAVAFAQGSTKQITERISQLGTELIQVTITGRNTNRDVQTFTESNAGVINAVAPYISANITVKAGRETVDTNVFGTTYDCSVRKVYYGYR